MIVRLWIAEVAEGRETDYREFAESRSAAMFRAQRGCLGVLFLKGKAQERVVCSFWSSREDVSALSQSETYQATARALEESGIIRATQLTAYETLRGVLDITTLSAACFPPIS